MSGGFPFWRSGTVSELHSANAWVRIMSGAMILMAVLLVATLTVGVYALVRVADTVDDVATTRREACTSIVALTESVQEAWINAVNRPQVGTAEQQAATQKVNDRLVELVEKLQMSERKLIDSTFCQDYQH